MYVPAFALVCIGQQRIIAGEKTKVPGLDAIDTGLSSAPCQLCSHIFGAILPRTPAFGVTFRGFSRKGATSSVTWARHAAML